jgi:hypothetical protein
MLVDVPARGCQEDATGAGHDPLNACAELLAAADLIKG